METNNTKNNPCGCRKFQISALNKLQCNVKIIHYGTWTVFSELFLNVL